MLYWTLVCKDINWFLHLLSSTPSFLILGLKENSIDNLVFDTLIPKPIIQRYLNLLMEHRRIILSGPSGTGKSFMAAKLAEFIISQMGQRVTEHNLASFNVDQNSSKVRKERLGVGGICSFILWSWCMQVAEYIFSFLVTNEGETGFLYITCRYFFRSSKMTGCVAFWSFFCYCVCRNWGLLLLLLYSFPCMITECSYKIAVLEKKALILKDWLNNLTFVSHVFDHPWRKTS